MEWVQEGETSKCKDMSLPFGGFFQEIISQKTLQKIKTEVPVTQRMIQYAGQFGTMSGMIQTQCAYI